MVDQMTHTERIGAALAGHDVDRVPVSMWRHFFAAERTARGLADAMLGFQRQFDWDFMKVNPRASYHVEDWGVKTEYRGDSEPHVVARPVKVPADWLKLEPLDIHDGALGKQLTCLEMIAKELKGNVPFIMTVFTPLAIASRMAESEDIFLSHLREHTKEVSYALAVITDTFTRFSKACLERGASGLFYATTAWATTDRLTEKEYRKYARPTDLQLLDRLPVASFNVLHVCRAHNLLHAVRDYPVQAFSWDARGEGNPSLEEGRKMVGGKVVIGGMPHDHSLTEADPKVLAAEVRGIKIALGKKGWMLGPGCTFPPETPEANLRAIREAVG